ncbi:Fcf2 pre-rRNA processing-domain-containing protein [Xylariales sp. PMI_506]|nr:Fcf2 pre-rRNA processing-domain-containing protein [Xylariales sp. PMI_506]
MADTMVDPAVELTDDQIEKLLQEAEARLAAKENGKNLTAVALPAKLDVAAKPDSADGDSTDATVVGNKKQDALSVRAIQARLPKKEFEERVKATAGPSWFNMPKTDLTPELKRDLQLLKMRNVLDSKRHYKKDTSRSAVPAFSQVGTIVEGPTEYFSARMTKKERKRTLLEEVMETEDTTRKFKSKYGEIQAAKTSGKKGHYKKMMQKRYGNKR